MKKIIIFILGITIFALSLQEQFLIGNLFTKLFNKPVVKVYSNKKINFKVNNILVVNDCKKADIVIGVIKKCNKPQFVLDYYTYKNNKEVLGAFYWRKGRPQIRLREKLLKKYNLKITKDMKDFLE